MARKHTHMRIIMLNIFAQLLLQHCRLNVLLAASDLQRGQLLRLLARVDSCL